MAGSRANSGASWPDPSVVDCDVSAVEPTGQHLDPACRPARLAVDEAVPSDRRGPASLRDRWLRSRNRSWRRRCVVRRPVTTVAAIPPDGESPPTVGCFDGLSCAPMCLVVRSMRGWHRVPRGRFRGCICCGISRCFRCVDELFRDPLVGYRGAAAGRRSARRAHRYPEMRDGVVFRHVAERFDVEELRNLVVAPDDAPVPDCRIPEPALDGWRRSFVFERSGSTLARGRNEQHVVGELERLNRLLAQRRRRIQQDDVVEPPKCFDETRAAGRGRCPRPFAWSRSARLTGRRRFRTCLRDRRVAGEHVVTSRPRRCRCRHRERR